MHPHSASMQRSGEDPSSASLYAKGLAVSSHHKLCNTNLINARAHAECGRGLLVENLQAQLACLLHAPYW